MNKLSNWMLVAVAVFAFGCGDDAAKKAEEAKAAAAKTAEAAKKGAEAAKKDVKKAAATAKAEVKKVVGAAKAATATAAAAAGVANNTVTLSSNDQMQFDMKEITVKQGTKVTLTLKHTGKMAKAVMGHNFVLLKAGTDLASFSQAAIKAGAAKEYVPADSVLASTKLIGGGESVTITFDAPAVGTYDFLCSFPGHYSIMKGKFIVK